MKTKNSIIPLTAAIGLGLATSAQAIMFGDPVTLNYNLSDGTTGSVTFDILDLIDDRGYAEGFTAIDNNGDGLITAEDDNQFEFWLQDVTIGYKLDNAIAVDTNLNTKYQITQVFNATELVTAATVNTDGSVTANFELVTVQEYKLYFDDLTDGGAVANPNIVDNYTDDFVLLSSTSEFIEGAECPGTSSFTAFSTTAGRGEYSVCFDNLTGSANTAVASLTLPDVIQVDGQLDVPPSTVVSQMYDGTVVSVGGDPTQEPGQNVLFNVDDDIQFNREVPEPSAIAALGLGLGALGFLNGIRRRNKNA